MSWIGWINSAVVLALLFLTGVLLKNPVRLFLTGKKTTGMLVGIDTTTRFSDSPEANSLQSPIVEFVTSGGEKVTITSRSYTPSISISVGDPVALLYNESNPQDAQLLMWREFIGAFFTLGFTLLIILMWISAILISGDTKLDDPFHLLPALIDHFRLNPFRFPIIFLLSLVIPLCGFGTYILTKQAIDLRSHGIIVPGHVVGYQESKSKMNDGSEASGVFPMIKYKDATGTSHTIRRSLGKPLSRLKSGDVVEVIYPIRHPGKGVVNTWDEFWPAPIFFGFLMVAFLVCFVLVLKGVMG
ncbi:MAG: DUF3592 domain-containing protein [Bacteroidales bacterium]|nr:DUF3592 domain-containing protein [Bacteroidales bacterium]